MTAPEVQPLPFSYFFHQLRLSFFLFLFPFPPLPFYFSFFVVVRILLLLRFCPFRFLPSFEIGYCLFLSLFPLANESFVSSFRSFFLHFASLLLFHVLSPHRLSILLSCWREFLALYFHHYFGDFYRWNETAVPVYRVLILHEHSGLIRFLSVCRACFWSCIPLRNTIPVQYRYVIMISSPEAVFYSGNQGGTTHIPMDENFVPRLFRYTVLGKLRNEVFQFTV